MARISTRSRLIGGLLNLEFIYKLDVVAHNFNLNAWEAEADQVPGVQGQLEL